MVNAQFARVLLTAYPRIALPPAINKATKKHSSEKISAFHTTTNICESLFAQWLLPPREMRIPLQTINDTTKSLHSF